MPTDIIVKTAGTQRTGINTCRVVKTIADTNASANFTTTFDNRNAQHASTFSIGNEVTILADKDASPTTSIFVGIIEDIKFSGKGQQEKVTISGRDYTARLMDVTIEPEVYSDDEVSVIIKDFMGKYVDDITTTNVATTTTTLTSIAFNHKNPFDALKQLAELSDHTFWVDTSKDLHFQPKDATHSGQTLDSTNVRKAKFKTTDKEVYNDVWVYGDTFITTRQNSFTQDAGLGSVFTLDYKPHNTSVTVNSVQQNGGVFEMLSTQSGVHYAVDYHNQQLVFLSGTAAEGGNNIPQDESGIVCDYGWDKRIVKHRSDEDSVARYGRRVKVINDKNIKEPHMAVDIVNEQLDLHSEERTMGDLDIQSIVALTPGNLVTVDLPNHNVDSEDFTILQVTYNFNQVTMLMDEVLKVKVAEKIKDMIDTLKQMALDIKKLQVADTAASDVSTRIMGAIGSIGLRHNWYVKSKDNYNAFILGNPRYDKLGSNTTDRIAVLGGSMTALATHFSGGTF